MDNLNNKYQSLKKLLKSYGRVIVAFSGGVDSSLLVKVSHDMLKDDMIAITSKSATLADNEFKEVIEFIDQIGCKHEFIEYEETDNENFKKNPKNRCYYCKNMLFSKLKKYAIENSYKYVVDGTNFDDIKGHRPGLDAARELGIKSPLLEICFNKNEIRELSKKIGLTNYDKPEMACLSSRFPTGNSITIQKLRMVDRAESFIKKLGVNQLRVRHLGETAKIEVLDYDFDKINDNFKMIEDKLKIIGFNKVIIDEKGYRRGSLVEI